MIENQIFCKQEVGRILSDVDLIRTIRANILLCPRKDGCISQDARFSIPKGKYRFCTRATPHDAFLSKVTSNKVGQAQINEQGCTDLPQKSPIILYQLGF